MKAAVLPLRRLLGGGAEGQFEVRELAFDDLRRRRPVEGRAPGDQPAVEQGGQNDQGQGDAAEERQLLLPSPEREQTDGDCGDHEPAAHAELVQARGAQAGRHRVQVRGKLGVHALGVRGGGVAHDGWCGGAWWLRR